MKELFEEQDKKENLEVRSEIKLLSPIEEVLHVWKHCNATLWSPLQDILWTPILSNQYLLLVTNLYHTHKCTHPHVLHTQAYCLCHTDGPSSKSGVCQKWSGQTYIHTYSQCGTGLQELIQQNLQHKETLCLLHLTVLQCLA
jgi:hypothetical protein